MTLSQEQIDNLKKLARRECWADDPDYNPCEYSGGNYDDAYYGGRGDGAAVLARDILRSLSIEW